MLANKQFYVNEDGFFLLFFFPYFFRFQIKVEAKIPKKQQKKIKYLTKERGKRNKKKKKYISCHETQIFTKMIASYVVCCLGNKP